MTDPTVSPGGPPPRDGRELEDGGPALRVSERQHPGGAGVQAEIGRGPLVIEGPPEEISREVARSRERSMRRERLLPAFGVAALFVAAAVSFWASGAQRGDGLLQALGGLLLALAIGAVLVGVVLARSD